MNKYPQVNNNVNSKKLATVILPFNPNKIAQPNSENLVTAGTIVQLEKEPAIVAYRLDIPFLDHLDGAIEINGDSMSPTYPPGCKIGIYRLNNRRVLNWGNCYYVINVNFQGNVRRIFEGDNENSLRLVCDNPDQKLFPPTQIGWDHIELILGIRITIIKQQ